VTPSAYTGSPGAFRDDARARLTSGITPTAVITSVGSTGPSADSLYRLSFPDTNGAPKAEAKSRQALRASSSDHMDSGLSGLPQEKLSSRDHLLPPTAALLRSASSMLEAAIQ
jgi:hypothetical protein